MSSNLVIVPSTPIYLGEKPSGVSPSRVGQFIKCPRQYQYVSVERLPEKKSAAAFQGTIFHAALEYLYALAETPADRTLENALQIFREVYPTMMTPEAMVELDFDAVARQKMAVEISRMIRVYFHMESPPDIEVVSTEMRLDYPMGEDWGLRGIIDRLDRNERGELVIVDYKTGKVPKPQYEGEALAACRVYAYLCQQVFGEQPTEMKLLYVKTGVTLSRPVWERDIEEAEARVRGVWQNIEECYKRGYFPPQPSILCNWCAFLEPCLADRNSII